MEAVKETGFMVVFNSSLIMHFNNRIRDGEKCCRL